MSIDVTKEVWDNSTATGTKLLVLLAIADNARSDDAVGWPSHNSVARRARCTTRQVRYHIQSLIEMNELAVIRNGGSGPRDTNVYQITVGRYLRVKPISPFSRALAHKNGSKVEIDGQLRGKPISTEPSIEPSKKEKTSQGGKAAPSERVTWLTPYAKIWESAFGGELPYGEASRWLKRAEDRYGHEATLAHFAAYCKKTDAPFASIHKFYSTFGSWGRHRANGRPNPLVDFIQNQQEVAKGL